MAVNKIEMNSSESAIYPIGNFTPSLILVVGISCPNLILGLAINGVLLFGLHQSRGYRQQEVCFLFIFVATSDVFNAVFGPVSMLLRRFDKQDAFGYFYLVQCFDDLFKVMSSLFQSAVQLHRILQYSSPVLATKCFNRNSLIFIVPGLLGLSCFVAILPYITLDNVLDFENHQKIHNSVWFRAIYSVSTAGFISVFSVILLLILIQRLFKRQCSVRLHKDVVQEIYTVSSNPRKQTKSLRTKGPKFSVGYKPSALHHGSDCFETNLSESTPDLRHYMFLNAAKKTQHRYMTTDMEAHPKIHELQHSINRTKRRNMHKDMDPTTSESTNNHLFGGSGDDWLSSKTKKTMMVKKKRLLKRWSQVIRYRFSNLVVPINNTSAGEKRNGGKIKEVRKPHTMLASPSQERNPVVRTKLSLPGYKIVRKNGRHERHHWSLTKQRSLSFGNESEKINFLPSGICVKSVQVRLRKILLIVLFVSAIFLSGIHNITYIFETMVSPRVEFLSILFSNFMCVINPVYNILLCEKVLKIYDIQRPMEKQKG